MLAISTYWTNKSQNYPPFSLQVLPANFGDCIFFIYFLHQSGAIISEICNLTSCMHAVIFHHSLFVCTIGISHAWVLHQSLLVSFKSQHPFLTSLETWILSFGSYWFLIFCLHSQLICHFSSIVGTSKIICHFSSIVGTSKKVYRKGGRTWQFAHVHRCTHCMWSWLSTTCLHHDRVHSKCQQFASQVGHELCIQLSCVWVLHQLKKIPAWHMHKQSWMLCKVIHCTRCVLASKKLSEFGTFIHSYSRRS